MYKPRPFDATDPLREARGIVLGTAAGALLWLSVACTLLAVIEGWGG